MHHSFGIAKEKEKNQKDLDALNAQLLSAIESFNVEGVKEVLAKGADLNCQQKDFIGNDTNALYRAMDALKSNYEKYERKKVKPKFFDESNEIVQILLKSGANIRQECFIVGGSAVTPLELAYDLLSKGVPRNSCFDEILKSINPSNQKNSDLYAAVSQGKNNFSSVQALTKDLYVKLGVPKIGAVFDYQTNVANKKVSSFKKDEAPLCFQDSQLYGRYGMMWQPSLDVFRKSLEHYFLQMDPNDPCLNTIKLIHQQLPEISISPDIKEKIRVKESKELDRKLKNDELVIIPAGWPEHSITLAIWRGYLVVSNKGEGAESIGPCKIYSLKNKLISTQDLKGILAEQSQSTVIKNIFDLVEDQAINLPASFQKYGTCSYTNKKNMIRGILFLENLGSKKWTDLSKNEQEALIEKTQAQYQQYQQYDRTSYINGLVTLANLAQEVGQKEDAEVLLKELSFYMIWHCDDLKEFQSYNNIIEPLTKENKLTLMELIHLPGRELSVSELKNTAESTWVEQIKNEIYFTALNLKINGESCFERSKNSMEHFEVIAAKFPQIDLYDRHNPLLFNALMSGDEKLLLKVLSLPNFSKKKFEEAYPFSMLGYALMGGNLAIIEKVSGPTEINRLQNNGVTPLIQAINSNYGKEIIALLIEKGANIHVADKNGNTPFSKALENLDILELFVNNPITMEQLTKEQRMEALFVLAKTGSHSSVMKQLINSNIDLNHKHGNGMTLIHLAVVNNNHDMLKTLLEQPNIDINITNKAGVSPLLMCVYKDNKDMFKTLLQHGAKIDKDDTNISDFLEEHNISTNIKSTPGR